MIKILKTPNKIFITGNQVCMKRGLDAERLRRYFLANGCELTRTPQGADIIIAVTCAFISSYVKTALVMIESLKKYDARLIVMGCLPAMAPAEFKAISDGPALATKELDEVDRLFPDFTVPWASIPDANVPDVDVMMNFDPSDSCPIYIRNSVTTGKPPGPFLRIAWGCNNRCSYCSHPAALGPFKSKPLETCLQEYLALLEAGHRHIVLHANDPADYGRDIGLTYPDLLHKLDEAALNVQVRWSLSDINPARLVQYSVELIPFFKKGRIVSVGVPMQSGSPAVLRRMRRYSHIDRIEAVMQTIHAASSDVRLATHLIVGFPGETLDDLEMTVQAVQRCGYHRAMVFPFSANIATSAEKMGDRLSGETVMARQLLLCERLEQLGLMVDRFQ